MRPNYFRGNAVHFPCIYFLNLCTSVTLCLSVNEFLLFAASSFMCLGVCIVKYIEDPLLDMYAFSRLSCNSVLLRMFLFTNQAFSVICAYAVLKKIYILILLFI